MCDLYSIAAGFHAITRTLVEMLKMPLLSPPGITAETSNMTISSTIYPRRAGLVVRPADALQPMLGLEAVIMHWGLTPFFHKGSLQDWNAGTHHCRSETMHAMPTFRDAYRNRRCLIPASEITQWTGPEERKTAHVIRRADGAVMLLAGLWDRCRIDDEDVESYAMVMMDTAPGHDMHPFNTRQPVILDIDRAKTWLDPSADGRVAIAAPPAGTLIADPPEPAAT